MTDFIERLATKIVVSTLWRIKSVRLGAIQRFQRTEADGVWHLLYGARRVSDPKFRAWIFGHIVEEESHAETFGKLYDQESSRPRSPSSDERKRLYAENTPGWKLVTYVHVGEEDAVRRFRAISSALEPGDLKRSLDKIIHDEQGHTDLTAHLSRMLGATSAQVRIETLKIRATRYWENWLRIGRRPLNFLASILLSVVYYGAGWALYPTARRKVPVS